MKQHVCDENHVIKRSLSLNVRLCLISLTLITILFNTNVNATQTQDDIVPASYQKNLANWKTHRFNDNQIRAFVYTWFGLHDKHVSVDKTLILLSPHNLLMQFPDGTIHNAKEYRNWYQHVGENIQNNQHIIQSINITMLANHQYQLDVIVNWQAINKQGKFINMLAKQRWLLTDGESQYHPYVMRYDVLQFTPITS